MKVELNFDELGHIINAMTVDIHREEEKLDRVREERWAKETEKGLENTETNNGEDMMQDYIDYLKNLKSKIKYAERNYIND